MKIRDASHLSRDSRLQYDIAVVGAGAAGLVLARELSRSGLNIILLEAGEREDSPVAQRDCDGEYTSTLKGRSLVTARWRSIGGSTLRWAGQCGRMLETDFEKRSWVAHSGWPFGLSELTPYYERAESLLGLPEKEPEIIVSVSENGEPILVSHHFQFPEVRDFRNLFLEDLISAENTAIFINAPVVNIQAADSGEQISEIHVRTRQGETARVGARAFVLATGGVDNARLLLVSRSIQQEGLGNGRGVVGRYFMDHPYLCSATCALNGVLTAWPDSTVPDYNKIFLRNSVRVIQFDDSWLRGQELLNCGAIFIGRRRFKAHEDYLSQPVDDFHSLLELVSARVAGCGDTRRRFAGSVRGAIQIARAYLRALDPRQLVNDAAVIRATLEPVPDPDSRVRLSSRKDRFGVPLPEIDWRMGDQELDSMERLHVALAAAMNQAGLESPRVRLQRSAETGWPAPMQGGRHHIGTTRMHDDPSRGVVDQNCKVHDIRNLFVAGSSVFPTASYVNPTLTILALSLRLADRLKQDYR